MEFIAAKCPNCGGELRLPDNMKTAKCMYCGFDVIVRDAINAAGVNVENLLKLASVAQDAGNDSEAYNYFTRVLEYEPNNYIALLGKAASAGRLSTSANFRLEELIKGVESAIENTPNNKKDEIKKQSAELISEICTNHEVEFSKENKPLIDCLEIGYNYNPENLAIISSIISKTHSIILANQSSIETSEGFIDMYGGFIASATKRAYKEYPEQYQRYKKDLEKYTELLNQEIEELNHYTHLKKKYLEKLQSINSEAALSLGRTLQKSEEENNEGFRSSQRIKAMPTTGGGCLVAVVTIFTTITIFFIFLV
jgi:tetratricopeptide (TPR) repeat protein